MSQMRMLCGHVTAWLWVATLGMCCVCSVDALGIGQGTVFESTAAPGGNNALYLHLTSQGSAFVAGNEIAVRPRNLPPFLTLGCWLPRARQVARKGSLSAGRMSPRRRCEA
jgi:hypothetical protein